MSTRRSFLKSFVGIIVSAALAQRVMLDALTVAPCSADEATPMVNPEWVDAPYEVSYFHPDACIRSNELSLRNRGVGINLNDIERFDFKNGEFVKVPRT